MELIDRLEVIKELEMSAVFFPEYKDGIKHAIDALNYAPTIDTEPVRHGRWIFVGEETMHDGWTYRKHKCSECDFLTTEAKNFCQNCGSKMYGGAENG